MYCWHLKLLDNKRQTLFIFLRRHTWTTWTTGWSSTCGSCPSDAGSCVPKRRSALWGPRPRLQPRSCCCRRPARRVLLNPEPEGQRWVLRRSWGPGEPRPRQSELGVLKFCRSHPAEGQTSNRSQNVLIRTRKGNITFWGEQQEVSCPASINIITHWTRMCAEVKCGGCKTT